MGRSNKIKIPKIPSCNFYYKKKIIDTAQIIDSAIIYITKSSQLIYVHNKSVGIRSFKNTSMNYIIYKTINRTYFTKASGGMRPRF
jgi:hypothetical protein